MPIICCQAQLSLLNPQLKLIFSFIPSHTIIPPHPTPPPHHPEKSSKLHCRSVPVDFKLQVSQAFNSCHSNLSRLAQLVCS